MSVVAGARFGPYEIIAPLGAGGMGEVWRARDTRLSREVAIKVLPASLTDNADRVRRFEQEARAASALNHPNIITIHEIGEAEAGRYIVMELVKGSTFRSIGTKRPSMASFIRWGRQLAEAIGVAHEAGIIHRDIKPENIMLRDDGYVKMLDFGLARLAPNAIENPEGEQLARTDPGTMLGTMRYMAPEQTRGETATTATDIFALGVVFYELATGEHPFSAGTVLALLQAIAARRPVPPSHLNPEIAAPIETIILRMLEKEARRRPSASEVEIALAESQGAAGEAGTSRLVIAAVPERKTVGREKELAELRAGLVEAEGGRGLLLCVAGEPGIGKTTLVEDFLAEVSASSDWCRVARGRCSERLAGAEAYLPLLEALDSLLRHEGSISLAQTMRFGQGSIGQTMRQLAPTWYAQVAPLSSDNSSAEKLIADLKAASQERMKLELAALLKDASRTRPLILFFDDLHWADVSTIDLLAYLASKFEGMRVLIIITYRPSDMLVSRHPFLQIKPDLQAHGVCREIPLEFLTRTEIEHYLGLQFPDHHFPAELPLLIHAKTEGNPLFMADLVSYLRDRQVIAPDPADQGHWRLVRSLPEIERELPESVRGMIGQKIAQLSDEDRRLLIAASVQGYEFDSAVVAQALEMDPAEVEERLETLERVFAFVRLVAEREFPDHTLTLRYRFVHVLYQNALYASLRPTRRAQLSGAVAKALAGCWGEQSGNVASELANLFEAARDYAHAAEYYQVAAEHAANVLANVEAGVLARRGLAMLKRLPASGEWAQLELKLQLALGFALIFTQGYSSPEAGQNMTAARELCEQMGETPQLFSAIWGLWLYYTVGGKLDEARQMGEQLLRLAKKVDTPLLMVGAHFALGFNLFWLGEMIEGQEHFEQGRALYKPQQRSAFRLLYRTQPGMACHSFPIRALWMLGFPDQGRRRMQETLDLAREWDDPHDIAFTENLAAGFHMLCGEADRARAMAEDCIVLSNKHGLPQERQWATIWLGAALVELGEVEEGLQLIRNSLAAQRAMSAKVSFTNYLALLADGLWKAGEVEEGLTVVAEAFETMEQTGERFYGAELYRLKGELFLKSGDIRRVEESQACFERAMEIARAQRAKSWELRAAMSLSRLWTEFGRTHEARRVLSEVFDWFTEGFETADLKAARTLLDELA